MTKKEIVKTISEEVDLPQQKTKHIVQKAFNAIIETLLLEGRVELRNFGVFEVKERAARKARNPRTGDNVSVPPKFVVTFKPGREMEQRVQELESLPQPLTQKKKRTRGSDQDEDFDQANVVTEVDHSLNADFVAGAKTSRDETGSTSRSEGSARDEKLLS